MNVVSLIITKFFDVILLPFGAHHTLALIVISLFMGLGMAYLFKITSNQKSIRRAKDRFKSRILEMRIYQDDLISLFKAFFGAIWSNVYYLRHSVRPILFIIVPVVLILIQMDARYSRKALEPGDTAILTMSLEDGADPFSLKTSLEGGDGVSVDSRPVRVADPPEINWRLKLVSAGIHNVTVSLDEGRYVFPVVSQERHRSIGFERRAHSFWDPLFHPGLPSIPNGSQIAGIEVRYPSASHALFVSRGWRTHWLVVLLFYSLVGAIASKFLLKVEI